MRLLLTFTGFHDPYSVGLVGEEQQPGPILSLVRDSSFDRVVLFSTPNTSVNTRATASALEHISPGVEIEVVDLPLDDPTDYLSILRGLRIHLPKIIEQAPVSELYISVASGTPQMHACWVLLAASGEIPGRILHVRPPRFVTKERPLVTEVDLSAPEFPVVRRGTATAPTIIDSKLDFQTATQALGIVGDHPAFLKALEIAAILAQSDVPILLLGETGTGKEIMGRLIHLLSGRAADKFVAVNCAAIPKDLVESLLFGHKKGAFTGATSEGIGKFDLADGGTLFLDELGELPLETQAKLLRVIQDGMVEPLGVAKPHKVDVRLVAATNLNLRRAIKQGKFREDLYYRLNVGEITLPPLRERRSDIPKIALSALDRVNTTLKNPKRLTVSALQRLQAYDWPGNIRDLANVIERSARLARSQVLDADDLILTEPIGRPDPLSALPEPHDGFSLEEFLSSARKQLVLRALEISNGNQSEAARMLGITPQAVYKFLQKSQKEF